MTPRDIKLRFESYTKRHRDDYKHSEYISWLTGVYVRSAIASSFSRQNKYPDNPLLSNDVKAIAEKTGKTEEELNGEKVLMTMLVMEANAKLTAE